MKRKEVPCKPVKAKLSEHGTKKSVAKAKSKGKESKKQDSQLFVLVGDSFYLASSKTERKNYEQFEQKVKVNSTTLKKSRTRTSNHFGQNINLQEYVKTLSKEEKASLMRDLAKEIEPECVEKEEVAEEQEDKMGRLMEKLEGIKGEMVARWDDQIGKINHCFENEQIGLEEKNEKISLIQKIKNNKVSMINYTKLLFEKILREEPDIELEKSERMENIINSLNSISSVDPREVISHFHLDPRHFPSQETPSFKPSNQQHEKELEKLVEQSPRSERGYSEAIKIEESEKSESLIMSREHLKLDIRLDEVEFGKDHYDEEIIFNKPTSPEIFKSHEPLPAMTEVLKLDFVGERRDPFPKLSLVEHPPQDEFLCVGEQHQIEIPLLMTKDRMEQMELQKSAKEIETLTMCMKARQAFQISELMSEDTEHFTTLIDVNTFIVHLYEYITRNFMKEVIEGMNLPYGKSCVDKLFLLHQNGIIGDHEHTNVLTDEILNHFHTHYALNVRLLKEEEKAHNKALFHAFNSGLNVYRPYFQLEGEVFPWNTSEKGLTFYEINEDNIEQVFEKSKMKVLQYCSSLCGLCPGCPTTTFEARKILEKRNEDCYERVMKAEMTEQFSQWNIKIINFQALYRINLAEEIFDNEIQKVCEEIFRF